MVVVVTIYELFTPDEDPAFLPPLPAIMTDWFSATAVLTVSIEALLRPMRLPPAALFVACKLKLFEWLTLLLAAAS